MTCKRCEVRTRAGQVICKKGMQLLTLEVKVHNFIAFHRKNMSEICGEKTTFHSLSYMFFLFFLDPRYQIYQIYASVFHKLFCKLFCFINYFAKKLRLFFI